MLNDCKYGVSVTDGNLRLSLHRGGTHPDVTGDCGDHEMTYSLLVHDSPFGAKSVVHPAYMLNVPLESAAGKAELPRLAAVSAENVVIESVKPAEDDSDAFVLRLYECEGTKTNARVQLGVPVSRAVLTNMLVDEKQPLDCTDGVIGLSFRPFEIQTVKLYRAGK